MSPASMNLRTRIENARLQLEQFEKLLFDAKSELLHANFTPQWAATMLRNDEQFRWRLTKDFFEPYQASGAYPLDRLPKATYWLMDLKLECYLLQDSLIPIHNGAVFSKEGFSLTNPRTRPSIYMHHLAITQAMIGAVRIMWERLMGLVYYLETGQDAQRKGSVRRAFFREIDNWEHRWRPLKEWESELEWYDGLYRTPEFHNNSTLRAGLFKDALPDPNSIISLLAPVANGFWSLLTANVKGVPSGVVRLGGNVDSFRRMDTELSSD